jgi:glutathionylspermidine synthase
VPQHVRHSHRLSQLVGFLRQQRVIVIGAHQDGLKLVDIRADARRLRRHRPWLLLRQLNAVQRIACEERADWREQADKAGFAFHTIDGQRYWDERAYYAFTLKEIENDIEAPTAEIEQMCYDLIDRAVKDERILRALRIPERCWTLIATSWKRRDKNLYGRFDLSYDGRGPAKLLEYNADTPTAVFETAVFQWQWLEQAIACGIVPKSADQYNSLHERLIEGWKAIGLGAHLHLAGSTTSAEDIGTLQYIEDTARQAGLATTVLAMDAIGRMPDGRFVDLDNKPITLLFKLYPWEWMFRERFGAYLAGASTRFVEPPWKAILSNKGILPLLWSMFPGHSNLLPAYFEGDPEAEKLGKSFVRKPLYSREGANVEMVVNGEMIDSDAGPYGGEGHVRQAMATLPRFGDHYAVIGSWIAAGLPCGLSIREDVSAITKNTSRFVPHAIVG